MAERTTDSERGYDDPRRTSTAMPDGGREGAMRGGPGYDWRGSGTDINSDTERLRNPENLQDKTEEDTFPASDPPSASPRTGVGLRRDKTVEGALYGSSSNSDPDSASRSKPVSDLPADFKDDPAAQFEYGRKSQIATHHFDRTSRRLESGNPDVGEIDLGTVEADRPAQPDDHDHWDTADDDLDRNRDI